MQHNETKHKLKLKIILIKLIKIKWIDSKINFNYNSKIKCLNLKNQIFIKN